MLLALAHEVDFSRVLIKHDILEDASEADGIPDLGFFLFFETDALGVAAALDVEDAVVTPAVLVVADEGARWVCGERRFARACT